jgi:translation initiation factor IF-3
VLENGEQLGVMTFRDAQDKANELGLDLVVVVPDVVPPVVKIMDSGRHKFKEAKKRKLQQKHSKQMEMKEVRLRPVTEDHDLQVKLTAIRKFLKEGKSTQVCVVFKSKRELQFKEQGLKIIGKIIEELSEVASVEKNPCFNNKKLIVKLIPLSR